MSSVSSVLPRLGVSDVTFQGSGFPYIGIPLITDCGLRTPGARMITSYLARRSGVAAAVCVLIYSNGIFRRSNSTRHQPSGCVLYQVCMMATRAARTGCVLTVGAAPAAYTFNPNSLPALSISADGTFRTRNDPRLNLCPAASNGSSAASKEAEGKR